MSAETGGPAFPIHPASAMDGQLVRETQGMTLRDYFAAKAMQAFIARYEVEDESIARFSYDMADAMLAERESAAKQADHICPGCGCKGWTASCNKCTPY